MGIPLRRVRTAFAAAALLALASLALAGRPPGVLVHTGDRISAQIDAGDADAFAFDLGAGGSFGVLVKAKKPFLPHVRAFDPSGAEADVTKVVKGAGTSTVKIAKFVAPAGTTGTWKLVVDGAGGTTGTYTAQFTVTQPTGAKLKALAVPAGATVDVTFAAGDAATVTATILEKTPSPIAGAALLDPFGDPVTGGGAFTRKKTKLTLAKTSMESGFGVYVLRLTGGAADATVDATVAVKSAKVVKRTATLPPELRVDPLALDVANQGDLGTRVVLTGANFAGSTEFEYASAGLVIHEPTLDGTTGANFTLDVADDAPYGPHELFAYPPPLLGEPVRVGTTTVRAPDPTLASPSFAAIRQLDAGLVLDMTGTGFRSGGTLTISGAGVTVGATTVVSATSVQAPLTVASDAAFGARDVTYTQPAAGGGAAATLVGAITVRAPDPTVTALTQSIAKQGDAIDLVVTGTNFRDGGAIAITGDGLTLSNQRRLSDTQFELDVTVSASASFGARDVTYAQPASGGGASATLTGGLAIRAPNPTIATTSPPSARQGDSGVTLTVDGAGFRVGGAITVSGTGLTLGATNVVSATQATVSIDVASNATFGGRNVVFTQPGSGGGASATAIGAFVVKAPVPTAGTLSPGTLRQGDSATTLTFNGAGFRSGGAITVSGLGFTLGATNVVSATQATVSVDVAANATFGQRDVTFTQPAAGGGDFVTLTNAVVVKAPLPTITTVSPSVVKQNDTSVTVTLTGTGFRSGGAITIAGTGLTLGSTSVVDATTATIPVTVASNAAVGARDVTYTQPATGGGDSTVKTGGLSVNFPDPTFTGLSPGTVTQGQTGVTFTLTGTNFRDAATVDLGDLSITSYVRNSDVQATVVADVGANAVVGLRNATYGQPAAGGAVTATLTNALQVNAPTPTVGSISPTILRQGQTNQTLTVNGANFRSGGAVTISGANVTLGSTTIVSATQATVPVTVADTAAVGTRNVVFTQSAAGGGASGTGTNFLTVNHPDPTITGVSPTEVPQNGTGTLTVDGTGFRSGFSLSAGSGITLSSLQLVSATQVTAGYSVNAAATLGTRDVVYTQPSAGGGASATRTAAITVRSSAPTVTSISPTAWLPGQTNFTVRVVGTGFVSGTTVSASGSGITITNTSSGSPDTEMLLRVTVASNAATGLRDLTITPGSTGGPQAAFTAAVSVAPADPTINSFSMASISQGGQQAVIVGGTNFATGDTWSASGSGISFQSVSTANATTMIGIINAAAGATTGPRDFTVTHSAANGGRSVTLLAAFRVTGATPSVTSVNPPAIGVTATGGPTRNVPITVTGTNFMTGATFAISKSGGTGVTLKSGTTVVVSDTQINATLTVTAAATTGTWDVLVTNPSTLGNSGTTGNAILTIRASTVRTVNNVVASSGGPYGGERVTIYGAGFAAGDVVDFGTVRAVGTQYLDANTIATTVPAPASLSRTAATSVTVTVTSSGGSSAALTNAYAYAKDDLRFIVKSMWPVQGATGVSDNLKRVALLLSAPADTTTGTHGSTSGTNTFWFQSSGPLSSSARSFGPAGRWLVLQRTATSALPSAQFVVSVPTALLARSGTPLTPVRLASQGTQDQYNFTIASGTTDSTAPTLSSITPANSATGVGRSTRITLVFGEEIDPLTVTTSNITLTQSATTIPASIDLAADLKTVTITPETGLAANTTYTTTITSNVLDMCGNAFSATTRTFTTASSDTVAPTITSVVVEKLPADLDGSGTYVNSSGTGGNAFDPFLPKFGFLLEVSFADDDSGVDDAQFSAKCSAATATINPPNFELASNFTVTATGASWRVPSGTAVSPGENITFTFLVKDRSGNQSSSSVITIDVIDKDTTATGSSTTGHVGGDHDPFDAKQTWILRADLDAYTTTYSGSGTSAGATTSANSNNVGDFDEALRYVGLGSATMSATGASSAVNGVAVGTNNIVRNLVLKRIRELLRARYAIGQDGLAGADSVNIEFLLPGEQGSLAAAPAYSASNSFNSSNPFSEMSIGGTLGAESSAQGTSGTLGQAWIDARNLQQEANLNGGTGSITGIYMLGMFKSQIGAQSGSTWRAKVLDKFVTGFTGAVPVGEGSDDATVLAGSFDRTSGSNTAAQNARYDAVFDGVEMVSLYVSAIAAHEIGHSTGLVPDGAPKTGLFGGADYRNTFTEATSAVPNTSGHLDYLGNDIMAAATSFDDAALSGSDFKRFSPLDIAYLLNRHFHDEGR